MKRVRNQPTFTLRTKLFLLVTLVAVLALGLLGGLSVWAAGLEHEAFVGRQNLGLARVIAAMPEILHGLEAARPSAVLQPLATRLKRETGVDLIVVVDMAGQRHTHYDERYIETPYSAGDEARAMQGESYVSKCSCVGVHSVRGLAPVFGPDGRQAGIVVVGTFVDNVAAGLRGLRTILWFSLAISLALAAALAYWIAGGIKRSLHNLEPSEIAALLQERETLLHSLREGLIAVDGQGRITLMNDAACQLTGLDRSCLGAPADQVLPALRLSSPPAGGDTAEEQLLLEDRVVLCTRIPVAMGGKPAGVIATLRDKTEVSRMAAQLTGVQRFVEALRAQNHEFLNRLQTIAGLIHLKSYAEALAFISEVTAQRQHAIRQLIAHVGDPATAGLLLGKMSQAREKGVELQIRAGSRLDRLLPHFDSQAMVSVLGNLVENAMEAVALQPDGARRVEVALGDHPGGIALTVSDSGPGVPQALREQVFVSGFSTKGGGRGLGLALVSAQVTQAGGQVRVLDGPTGGAVFEVLIPRGPEGMQVGGELS